MGRSFDFQDQGHSKDLKYAYEIMGLGEEASQEEVRKRYLELMKIHHSDKGGNDGKASIIMKLMKSFRLALLNLMINVPR